MQLLNCKYSSHGQHSTCACKSNIFHAYATTKATAFSTLHVITAYAPGTNAPTNLDLHATYAKYCHVYMRAYRQIYTHMKSLASNIQQQTLYTYLTYTIE